MKKILLIIVAIIFTFPVMADQWQIYKNQKYKYEIQYPDNFEFHATSKETERDGKIFTVCLKNVSSLNGINGTIHPEMSLQEIALKKNAPTLTELDHGSVIQNTIYHKIIWSKTVINDTTALKMEVITNGTNELFNVNILMDKVEFSSILWGDCDEKVAEKIISTFKFYE